MNKSVVGFVAGILVIAIAIVCYLIVQGLDVKTDLTKQDVAKSEPQDATPAPEPADIGELAPPPDAPPADTPAPETRETTPAEVTFTRVVGTDGSYTPGGTVDVTLRVDAVNASALRALGIEESYPPTFAFDSFVSANRPDVPRVASPGSLEFAWINMPEFPYEFTYRLRAPAGATDPARFSGQTLFRTDGDEMRSSVVVSAAPAGEPAPASEMDAATETPATDTGAAPEQTPASPEPSPAPAATPDSPAPTPAVDEPKVADNAIVAVERSVAVEGYTAGQPLEISINMAYDGESPVMAMSLIETLPTGWTFGEWKTGTAPAVKPPANKAGILTFIWIQTPEFPLTFSYTVNVPEGEQGERQLVGEAVYRRTGEEEKSPLAVTAISNL